MATWSTRCSRSFYNSAATAVDKRDNSYVVAARIIYSFEPLVGAALAFVAAPIILGSASIVFVLSRRSPFVAHLRIGNNGPFWMWKLRTMWENSGVGRWSLVERISDSPVPEDKTTADPRVTSRFASLCRKYSIDELPQLFHVATGQMSLVGPRPMTREELVRYYGADAAEVLMLRAGVTGLWQVSGRNKLTYKQRRELDLQLVREYGIRLYVAILLRTIPKVLTGSDAR
jgi:lipopolysaccharide/colanic/teichoic acid biosynthesis glycosyltransferase